MTTTKTRTPAQIAGAARAAATRAANKAAKQTPMPLVQDESSSMDHDEPTSAPALQDESSRIGSLAAAKQALTAQVVAELGTTPEDADIETTEDDEEIDGEYHDDLDENGNPIPLDEEDEEPAPLDTSTLGYTGPMLALRERLAAGAYQKAINGQPCCGDAIAIKLGTLTPSQVIRACIIAINLPNNPYTHLNVGQQSMNLRNKLRGCMKRGEFGMGVVIEAVEQVEEEDQVAA